MKTLTPLLLLLIGITLGSYAYANSALFTLITLFAYPTNSTNFVQVQSKREMTRTECETQIFLLSDNKHTNLPFGRSTKWEVVGGKAKLKDGKIMVSRWDSNDAKLSFLCVPTSWKTK